MTCGLLLELAPAAPTPGYGTDQYAQQQAAPAYMPQQTQAYPQAGSVNPLTAVDVLRGQLGVDVALMDDLRFIVGAGGDDPTALALRAVGGAVLAHTVSGK